MCVLNARFSVLGSQFKIEKANLYETFCRGIGQYMYKNKAPAAHELDIQSKGVLCGILEAKLESEVEESVREGCRQEIDTL